MELLLQQLRIRQQMEQAIFARDDSGRTPFHYAAQAGHANILAMLVREVPSDIQAREQQQPGLLDLYDLWGHTPLHWASYNGKSFDLNFWVDRDGLAARFRFSRMHGAFIGLPIWLPLA